MKETLTSKEWLEKGLAPVKTLVGDENGTIQQQYFEDCMEQYANYRTKELENKIIEFSKQLKTISKGREYPNILQNIENQYNKHFNIK